LDYCEIKYGFNVNKFKFLNNNLEDDFDVI